MKTRVIIFIAIIAIAFGVWSLAPSYDLRASPADEIPTDISIKLGKPIIKKVSKKYSLILIPGADFHLVPGAPVVPVKTLIYKLPINVEVEHLEYRIETTTLEGKYRLLLTPQPKPLTPSDRRKDIFVEDPEIYNSSKPYPPQVVEYEVRRGIDPVSLERVNYLIMRLFPVRYYPETWTVELATNIELSITYKTVQISQIEPVQAVDLIVITSNTLQDAAVAFAEWKNSTGLVAKVYTVEWISSNYPGADTQEKIRNFVIDAVNAYGITWVVLLGDADVVPVRRAYIPGLGDLDYIETDLYYADLDGTWDTDGDGYYGEVEDDIDGVPDVIVGRLPASTLSEAYTIIDKLKNYNSRNEWFRRILLLGTVTFGDPLTPEGEMLKDYIEYKLLPEDFSWTKLYEGLGNLNPARAKEEMNKGYGIVNFAGHGNVDVWSFGEGGCFTNSDVYSLTNGYNTSIIVAMSCLTGDYADTDVCIGEAFLLHSSGGGIAYFGAADTAYGYTGYWITSGLAGEFDWRVIKAFKDIEDSGGTLSPGGLHVSAITGYLAKHGRSDKYDWYTVVEYGNLLGDPSLLLTGTGDSPPPPETPVLKGYVLDENGSPVANSVVEVYNYTSGVLLYNISTLTGYYELVNISYGTYTFKAYAKGYTPTQKDFYYPRVVMEVNLTLIPSEIQPNTILIVVDDDATPFTDPGVWPNEFIEVVEALGFNAMVWNESERGNPSLDILLNENVTAVIWHTGTYYDGAVSSEDAQTLIQFVEKGGRLLLEGEDIGFDHGDDEFMQKVAHAKYLVDDTNASVVEATEKHPVMEDLEHFTFASQPPYPDGVEPWNNGTQVAKYAETNYSAIIVYDGLYWGAGGRVVYIAFPVHYLSADTRKTLIENSIKWLTTSYVIKAKTDRESYAAGSTVKIVASVFNGTEPLTGVNATARVYYPNGTLAFEAQMRDDGMGGDDVPQDGNYTVIYEIPSGAPTSSYLVEVSAYIKGYTTIYDSKSFEVTAGGAVAFTIKVEDVVVIEGVIYMNITASNNASLIIRMVQYRIDGGEAVNVTKPIDGAYDSPTETVRIVIDTASYSLGEHKIEVRAIAEQSYASQWEQYRFLVRELEAKYNLIALLIPPLKPVYASDIAENVGSNLQGIWKWDVDKQEFIGYTPGVSPPEEDFLIEMGYGYFVYLAAPARFVEVG